MQSLPRSIRPPPICGSPACRWPRRWARSPPTWRAPGRWSNRPPPRARGWWCCPSWPIPVTCSKAARKPTRWPRQCRTAPARAPGSRWRNGWASIWWPASPRDGGRLYNSALVAGPQGYLGTYRKLHLWGDENLYFEPGDLGLPVFHTEFGRLGVAICYDGWFPEVYRLLAMRGADIVAVPTNWVPMPGQTPDGPAMAHALAIAGAHSNGLTVACADRVGIERGQPFVGRSLIVGAQGWTVAGPASHDREEILVAAVDLKAARRARQLNAFNHVLRDRRRDVYDEMLGAGPSPAADRTVT